ncbi:MAG: hypothetical protein M0P69_15875 [Bacteroidales bacterium]|jgi:hypothetical protein|nr:hypothetical protein [Bacteroidales bacterium]
MGKINHINIGTTVSIPNYRSIRLDIGIDYQLGEQPDIHEAREMLAEHLIAISTALESGSETQLAILLHVRDVLGYHQTPSTMERIKKLFRRPQNEE